MVHKISDAFILYPEPDDMQVKLKYWKIRHAESARLPEGQKDSKSFKAAANYMSIKAENEVVRIQAVNATTNTAFFVHWNTL